MIYQRIIEDLDNCNAQKLPGNTPTPNNVPSVLTLGFKRITTK